MEVAAPAQKAPDGVDLVHDLGAQDGGLVRGDQGSRRLPRGARRVALAESVGREGEVKTALPTKYHAQMLFGYAREEIDRCVDRLTQQAAIYRNVGRATRLRMETRGLFAAALTLASTAVATAKMLERGKFWMETQSIFFGRRWRRSPELWGPSAKSCLARSWSGFSIGADAVCIDRHLERLGVHPPDAVVQWRMWFDLYEKMYGSGETTLCVRWHEQILDWIAFRADRPRAWK